MNRTSVSFLFAAALAFAGCAGTPPAPAASPASSAAPLDGSSYEVTLAFPGEAPMKDTLNFQGGRFESTACTAVGFPQWSDYRAKTEGSGVAFAVLARNPDGTTMDWKATVQGDAVEGTATRTMAGKTATATVHGSRH